MSTITLEEAQGHLAEVIATLSPGELVIITQNDRPVARLMAEDVPHRVLRRAGSAKGMIEILTEDEDHLQDFAEYME